MASAYTPLCTRAACLIAKYDIHQGAKAPVLLPDSVIIDPENRDGLFPTVADVHDLGAAIIGCGFNVTMTRGVCCQLPPGADDRNKLICYNTNKCGVDACFPEVLSQHVMYTGLGGNTLNTFLRCVAQGLSVRDEKLQQLFGAVRDCL
jgi:hypothetical protein